MLFGGTLPPETIPHTTVFRQHVYHVVDGNVVWPSVHGPPGALARTAGGRGRVLHPVPEPR